MIAIHDLALEVFVGFVARLCLEIQVHRPTAPAVVLIRAVE